MRNLYKHNKVKKTLLSSAIIKMNINALKQCNDIKCKTTTTVGDYFKIQMLFFFNSHVSKRLMNGRS